LNTWYGKSQEPTVKKFTFLEWLRICFRGFFIILFICVNLVVFVLLRFVEKYFSNLKLSYQIVKLVSRTTLRILKIKLIVHGMPMTENGCVVANHVSWLDIFSLSSVQNIVFVSKSDVSAWFGIGVLARIVGVLFISRKRNQVIKNNLNFEKRLNKGEKLLFFPEGTSSDGLQVLPFKSSLFEALMNNNKISNLHVQGVSIVYTAPELEDKRFYGWWGKMEFLDHLLGILSTDKKGRIDLFFHSPHLVSSFKNRKILANTLYLDVASVFSSRGD
jgi:1-acyl-sn-glycerol-3-phosphate acyltransferase